MSPPDRSKTLRCVLCFCAVTGDGGGSDACVSYLSLVVLTGAVGFHWLFVVTVGRCYQTGVVCCWQREAGNRLTSRATFATGRKSVRRDFLLFIFSWEVGRLSGVCTHTAVAREGRYVPVQCLRFVRKGELCAPSAIRCDPMGKLKDFHVAGKRPKTCVSFHVHVSSDVSRRGHLIFYFFYIFSFSDRFVVGSV